MRAQVSLVRIYLDLNLVENLPDMRPDSSMRIYLAIVEELSVYVVSVIQSWRGFVFVPDNGPYSLVEEQSTVCTGECLPMCRRSIYGPGEYQYCFLKYLVSLIMLPC